MRPVLLVAAAAALSAQSTVSVDAARTIAPFKPIYRFFGYDEPN